MKRTLGRGLPLVVEFIVHAQALEQELAERYAEMADCMQVHNNPAVARLFRELADCGESRAGVLRRLMQGRRVPRVAPWEYRWLESGPTAAEDCLQRLHYQMTPYHALQLALRIERGTLAFYEGVLEESSDEQLRDLGIRLLTDIRHHLNLLQACMDREQDAQAMIPEDLDPPHMPE